MSRKRYLIFSYDGYYPGGGWHDFKGAFDTLEEAREALRNLEFQCEYEEIVDLDTLKIVKDERDREGYESL